MSSLSSRSSPSARLCFMTTTALALALLVSSTLPALAKAKAKSVEIHYETSASAIQAGDSFQLDVIVTTSSSRPLEELTLPDLSDFRVLRDHRSTMKSRKIVRGQSFVQTEFRYTYLLTADAAGRKRIGSARVKLGSEIAIANAEIITVTASSRPPLPRDERGDPTVKPGEKLPPYFLDVSFNKNEAFVGEGVTLSVRLYATSTISGRALDNPQWSQFWVEELGGSGSRPVQRDIEGKRYNVYTVSRKALFPLEAGELVIPPMSMQVETGSGFFDRGRSMVLRSDPATLIAKALPADGQPANFTLGNVGEWTLQANVSPRRLRVGEAATLQLVATGIGNVGQLTLPSLETEIDGVRLFPPSFNERKSVDAGRVSGVKVVEALLQPSRTGRIVIPSYTLEYFDPATRTYKKSKTDPITLQVARAENADDIAAGGVSKKEIVAGARPVHLGLRAPKPPVGNWPAPVGASLGLIAWFALSAVAQRRQREGIDGVAKKSRRAKARKKAMAAAREEKDLGQARTLVMDALADQLGEHVRALPTDALHDACLAGGLDAERARALVAFFDAVDAVRYTPQATASRVQLFDEGVRLQEALDREVSA